MALVTVASIGRLGVAGFTPCLFDGGNCLASRLNKGDSVSERGANIASGRTSFVAGIILLTYK